LPFRRLQTVRKALYTADYALLGAEWAAGIEKKSINDIVGSLMDDQRERFERELLRLRGCPFRRLLIVGSRQDIEEQRYRSKMKPQSVLASLACFEVRYQVPIIYCATPEAAGRQVETWLWWVAYETTKSANTLLRGCQAESARSEAP
jgi:ERCC4-type nuclease